MSKVGQAKIQIPQVRFERELQGKRGESIMRGYKAATRHNPFLTVRQFILSLIDAGLEKELNINQ